MKYLKHLHLSDNCDLACKSINIPVNGTDKLWSIEFYPSDNYFNIINNEQDTSEGHYACPYQLRICKGCDCGIYPLPLKATYPNLPIYSGSYDASSNYIIYFQYRDQKGVYPPS